MTTDKEEEREIGCYLIVLISIVVVVVVVVFILLLSILSSSTYHIISKANQHIRSTLPPPSHHIIFWIALRKIFVAVDDLAINDQNTKRQKHSQHHILDLVSPRIGLCDFFWISLSLCTLGSERNAI